MKPIRLPVAACDGEDTDTKSIGASPKFFSNMFHGGRLRKSSISGESLGCLSLLDAGEQVERPRAFPSPGEILPTYVKVQAQPTIHIHSPRAVLSAPENDELLSCELRGQQVEKSIITSSAPKAVPSPSEDLPHAPLTLVEDCFLLVPANEVPKAGTSPIDEPLGVTERETSISEQGRQGEKSIIASSAPKAVPSPSEDLPHALLTSVEDCDSLVPSNEVPNAVASPLDEHLGVTKRQTLISEAASPCSTSSNQEHINELLPSIGKSNGVVDIQKYRTRMSEATKEKKFNRGLPPESRLEWNSNEENLSGATAANRMVKKHTSLPSSASRGPTKQQLSKPTSKGNSGRVLRPWY